VLIGVFGKGGVGKTTVALGLGLILGRARIVTTDPYPGLRELMPDPPEGLELLELSYDELREQWKREFGPQALEVFKSVADLDWDFIEYLSTAPGLIEQYAVYRVVKEHQRDPAGLLIWDTQGAPGVMTLIRSELEFYGHLKKAPLYWGKLKRLLTKDVDVESIISRWRVVAEDTLEGLREMRSFVVVNPDKLSIKVGKSLAEELKAYTDFKGFVVNKSSPKRGAVLGSLGEDAPVLANVPELDDPGPRAVAEYLKSAIPAILG